MKKLKDLKENECIRISSKREAKAIKRLSGCNHTIKVMVGMYFSKSGHINVITPKLMDGFIYYPASDFIRPSVKEQLRQLTDRVGKLEANTMPVVDEQHVKELTDEEIVACEKLSFEKRAEAQQRIYDKQARAEQELTELPEKWAIRVTQDNADTVCEYLDTKWSYYQPKDYKGIGAGYVNFPAYKYRHLYFHHSADVENDYTEITFEQFEKWVLKNNEAGWYESMGAIVYYDGTNIQYGFNSDGGWLNLESTLTEAFAPAPHDEVEAALIGEAKRRGFVKGATFNSLVSGRTVIRETPIWVTIENRIYANDDNGTMWGVIFDNGQWAEVVAAEPEIDWGVPGQLVQPKEGTALFVTTGKGKSDISFSGKCLIPDEISKKGEYSNDWDIRDFKPFTGEITLSNAKD